MGTPDHLLAEENRRIRLLRISADLLFQVLMTHSADAGQADRMIRGLRNLATRLFPGKEHVFDLIYLPRFRRALQEAGAQEMPEILQASGRRAGQTPAGET